MDPLPFGLQWLIQGHYLSILAEPDPYRVYVGKRNQEIKLGTRIVRFNNLGFRSTSPIVGPKTPDLLRIAVFGDSVTFDTSARSNEDTWPGRLEKRLRELVPDRNIEVLNFGMGMYTHVTSLVNLALLHDYLRPDVALYLMGPNDMNWAHWRNFRVDGSTDRYLLSSIADATWGFHPVTQILRKSMVFSILYWRLVELSVAYLASINVDWSQSNDPLSQTDIVIGRFRTFVNFCRAGDSLPVFCTGLYDLGRVRSKRDDKYIRVLRRLHQETKDMCDEEGVANVNVESFQEGSGTFFTDEFHLSDAGRDAFVERIIETLTDARVLPPRARETESPG